MGKTRRIHIQHVDAEQLVAWFNYEGLSVPSFQPIFHRAVEVLEQMLADSPDMLEPFKKSWAIDAANREHEAVLAQEALE